MSEFDIFDYEEEIGPQGVSLGRVAHNLDHEAVRMLDGLLGRLSACDGSEVTMSRRGLIKVLEFLRILLVQNRYSIETLQPGGKVEHRVSQTRIDEQVLAQNPPHRGHPMGLAGGVVEHLANRTVEHLFQHVRNEGLVDLDMERDEVRRGYILRAQMLVQRPRPKRKDHR